MTKPAHARYSPLPIETVMPRGAGSEALPTMKPLIDSAFLMMTVQIVAPMSNIALPMIANAVDTRKARGCFKRPLERESQYTRRLVGTRANEAHHIKARAVHTVPIRSR